MGEIGKTFEFFPHCTYAGCKVYSYDLNIQFHGDDGGAQMHRMAWRYKVELDTYALFNKKNLTACGAKI